MNKNRVFLRLQNKPNQTQSNPIKPLFLSAELGSHGEARNPAALTGWGFLI
jgi:hypothetical protein